MYLPERKKQIKQSKKGGQAGWARKYVLTMNITLALVGLDHKQIGYMTSDVVLVASSITAKDFLQTVEIDSQYPVVERTKEKRKHTSAS